MVSPSLPDAPVRRRQLLSVPETILFVIAVLVALGFAWFTDSRWEDWYITYRASKNLANGNGLVFWPGQRVHSFTSPLGTLIPAALCALTGGQADDLVIWLFASSGQ
jgi:hypothetical protein